MTEDGSNHRTGLFSGFEGYRSATEDELIEAVTHWLVVLDTNVLLNLYNFQGSSLQDFTEVFEALGDRLFVPHQALDEFWRNRRTVLSENQGRHREQESIQKAFDDAESAFRKWHQRVVDRTKPPPANALRELQEARAAILEYMTQKNAEAAPILPDTPTHEDRILQKLEPLLAGRVGPPPDPSDLHRLQAEGRARVSAKIPPGYMDGEKNPDRAIGDFLVWQQAMDASRERNLPVLFVTQDQKEDWWADRGTKSMRARPELVTELIRYSGQRLLMIRAHDLVRLGGHLGVEVSQATVEEAELTYENIGGWDPDLVVLYLAVLEAWPEHFLILDQAVAQGGEITRQQMAEILGREESDSMRGIGRPYHTAIQRLIDAGDLDAELPVPLTAYYESGGYMSHFVMPPELVTLFKSELGVYN